MGIDSLTQQNMQNAGLSGIDRLASNAMFPQSQMDKTQYSVSSQLPTSAETLASDYDAPTNSYTGLATKPFAAGGIATLRYNGDEDGSQVQEPQNDLTLGNPDFKNLSFEILNNEEKVKSLNSLKEADPKQYKIELMNALGQSLKDQYNGNSNYEPTWKQFAELKSADPAQWNRNQLSWLGHQQGWQIGQNTSDRNEAGMPVIQDQIEQSKKAGLGEDEINSILANSSQSANVQNQNRIINEAQAGHGPMGMTTQDYLTVAAILGGGAAAAYFAPAAAAAGALEGGGALTTTELMGGAGGAFTPAAGSGASFTIAPGAYTTAAGVAGAGEAAQGLTVKDAYDAYKYANMGKNALGMASGDSGGTSSDSGNESINNPYAMSAGVAPTSTNGFGITGTTGLTGTLSASELYGNPFQNLSPNITLSKLSEFRNPAGIATLAGGGSISTLGSYSDGGRLLKGPGDGMSDNIPAKIGQSQPARLADGEFVVPADVVSHLGNGSTDAGAKQLYAMMDKIRKARTGTKKQGKQINPSKYLP